MVTRHSAVDTSDIRGLRTTAIIPSLSPFQEYEFVPLERNAKPYTASMHFFFFKIFYFKNICFMKWFSFLPQITTKLLHYSSAGYKRFV